MINDFKNTQDFGPIQGFIKKPQRGLLFIAMGEIHGDIIKEGGFWHEFLEQKP